MKEQYKFIDLFAGIGGVSLGFEEQGEYECVALVDNNVDAYETYLSNYPEAPYFCDDIRNISSEKLQDLIKMMNEKAMEPTDAPAFCIYASFIKEERYDDLGPSLILWLRLAIEQQLRKRRIKETDSTIANWLQTSRQQVSKYKTILHKLGYLNIDTTARIQKLSVQYSPKNAGFPCF